MPIISRFLGIIMSMYFNDHSPPHFHAKYGEYKITVDIHTGIVSGRFPKRALKLGMSYTKKNCLKIGIDAPKMNIVNI